MADMTDRHALPLLAAAQAQKEITHNEAITGLAMLAHPLAESMALSAPPASPAAGQMWIIGASPTGAWAGRGAHLALWTASGWRFQAPSEGMLCWVKATAALATYRPTGWTTMMSVSGIAVNGIAVVGARQTAIAGATGGATIDTQARATLDLILAALRNHGLIAT